MMAVYKPRGPNTASGPATTAFEVHGAPAHASHGSDVESLRTELAREQERLRKLWDAFKSQEDELAHLRSTSTLSSTSAAADARTVESLRREVELLSGDLRRAAEAQRRLEEDNNALREQARAGDEVNRRAAQAQSDLEQERERLAKLYVVYEEVEAERARLEQHIKEWDAWYHGVSPHLAEICRSIGGAPHQK